jgi:hypothetical protein
MKNIKLLVLSALVIFSSCTKSEKLSNDRKIISVETLTKKIKKPIELVSCNVTGTVDYSKLSLEQAVVFHNEAMEYIATQIEESNVYPKDEDEFRNQLEYYLETFLKSKGIISDFEVNSIANSKLFDKVLLNDSASKLSEQGNQICYQIEQIFNDYTEKNITKTEFSNSINQIVQNANSINDLSERKAVQLTAKICEGSTIFWENELQTLKEKMMKGRNSNNPIIQQFGKVPWGGVAYADASGAIQWGRVGFVAAGGPAGAVACGLAGAAGHSALRLLCYSIFGS